MSKDRVECPLCYRVSFEPQTSIRSVSWSMDCACSDAGRCAFHNYQPDDAPDRPSDTELLARAKQYNESEKEDFENLKKKVEFYHSIMEEVGTLRASLDDANWRLEGFVTASKMAQELVAKRQREETLKAAYYALKAALGKGEHQKILGDVIDKLREEVPLVTEEEP